MFYLISDKNLSSMMAIFLQNVLHSNNTINSKPLEYSVFHNGDNSIKLSLS